MRVVRVAAWQLTVPRGHAQALEDVLSELAKEFQQLSQAKVRDFLPGLWWRESRVA